MYTSEDVEYLIGMIRLNEKNVERSHSMAIMH